VSKSQWSYGSVGSCPRCDEPIHDYAEDAVRAGPGWVHRWCAAGADDDADPGQRLSRSGRRYDREATDLPYSRKRRRRR